MLNSSSKVLHWNIWAILNVAVASRFISLMLGTFLNMPVNCILDYLATALCYLRIENVSEAWSALSMVNVMLCECSQMFENKSIGSHCSFFYKTFDAFSGFSSCSWTTSCSSLLSWNKYHLSLTSEEPSYLNSFYMWKWISVLFWRFDVSL
jgi:hypothetical protein